jgi:molybdate transport system substrate-binding protein
MPSAADRVKEPGRYTPCVRILLAALALLAVAAGAGAQPALTVFAASDLAFAFQELLPLFERAHGAKVTVVLGSSGNFARQIQQGAPVDVYFSADEAFVDRLVAEGLVLADTRALYAQGRLALVTARAAGFRVSELAQLGEARVRRIAIANPVHAPYGRAAEQALRRAGLWDRVQPRLVYAENVRQALQYVETGAVEAGIVALSIARVPAVEWAPIDPSLHAPLNLAVGVVRTTARPDLARALLRFVTGPEGRPIMKRHGFLLPGEF